MLVNPVSLLKRARREGRAVAAFNVYNMETLQAVATAAERAVSPLLLQASADTVAYVGADYLVAMATAAARRGLVVALHLDHATDRSLIMECLEAGFTSVMYDGSRLPVDQNIAETLEVVRIARGYHAAVEAELGHVGSNDILEDHSLFTCPDEAEEFVLKTRVDSLAVAVGTVHGAYRGEPRLDFDRLAAIAARTAIPLVLHGGSGVPAGTLRQAISLGVAKVNFATELKAPFTNALRDALVAGSSNDPRSYMAMARQAVAEVATEKATLCWKKSKE
jgi:tagatose 1,6-diphosphate aldolase GatY/KbaY